ncbi:patatin-like phospholipase family protein [Coprobacter tertius]|uniref:Patatin-like phospholipase family protein n=1 Tax=Coprobacter tertius TaxID=2944915 RepID=A0ABT1MNI1_9BACT|nr:patatin-like phospholipase family protein [Coprobacter tertius]MCP9612846.1 patatin-like phospholipase family protein [Coprobacter tertius]
MINEEKSLATIKPYRIGLALSGGGARGFAHVGALKALEEMGLRPDIISGVSAGSIIGVLYADGYSPDEIIDLFSRLNFSDLAEITMPRAGFFKIDRFRNFLKKVLRANNFEDLSIPVIVSATDLDKGKTTTFAKGPIVEVVCASCSIPIIFPPIKINGVHYVDGGVFRNFPVSTIRQSCDIVIGVNVNPLVAKEYKQTLLGIAERSYSFIFKSNSLFDAKLCDVLIQTEEIAHFNIFDIVKLREIARFGYEAARNTLMLKESSDLIGKELLKPEESKKPFF